MELRDDELQWRFEPSGGPGGQHANRSATRVVLSFDVAASSTLSAADKERILGVVAGPIVTVTVDESRSQWANRKTARTKLLDILTAAAAPPGPPRKPTKPSGAARRRRVEDKRRRSQTKEQRRRPESE